MGYVIACVHYLLQTSIQEGHAIWLCLNNVSEEHISAVRDQGLRRELLHTEQSVRGRDVLRQNGTSLTKMDVK